MTEYMSCPNPECGASWGIEEVSFQECDSCGYPILSADDDDADDSHQPHNPIVDLFRKAKCCACESAMKDSEHVNMVALNHQANWEYPIMGNFETNTYQQACAVLCDTCIESTFEHVKFALELRGEEFIYHDVETLEKLPILASNERSCRVCGCTDNRACADGCYWVEDDLCSACADI